jgi:hypothetical protein
MLSSSFSSQSFFFKSFCFLFLQFPGKQMLKHKPFTLYCGAIFDILQAQKGASFHTSAV